MKLKNLLAIGVSLFAFGALMAHADYYNSCDPCPSLCDMCDPCDGWSAHVDWLYWKTRRADLDYAILGATSESEIGGTLPFGHLHCISPKYHSGFRVGVFKACDDFDFGVRYTWYDADQSSSVTSADGLLLPTFGLPVALAEFATLTSAAAEYDVSLNKIEVEAGYLHHLDCDGGYIRPFFGAQFTFIDQDLDVAYIGTDDPTEPADLAQVIRAKSNMDAYGLYAGVEGNVELWCNFGLYGRFAAGLSLADFDRHLRHDLDVIFDGTFVADFELANIHGKDCWSIVPNFEFAAGLSYDLCEFFCIDWNITVGYEFHQWTCLPDFINLSNDTATAHMDRHHACLGFDGLFVRLNAKF